MGTAWDPTWLSVMFRLTRRKNSLMYWLLTLPVRSVTRFAIFGSWELSKACHLFNYFGSLNGMYQYPRFHQASWCGRFVLIRHATIPHISSIFVLCVTAKSECISRIVQFRGQIPLWLSSLRDGLIWWNLRGWLSNSFNLCINPFETSVRENSIIMGNNQQYLYWVCGQNFRRGYTRLLSSRPLGWSDKSSNFFYTLFPIDEIGWTDQPIP
jgi:hypothetical protein